MNNRPGISRPHCLLRTAPSLALLLATTFLASCETKPAPQHAEIANKHTATAKVVSVDKDTRIIGLQNERGETLRVRAGPEVRNFAQINPGDTLRVQYQASLAVDLKKPEDTSPAMTVDAAAGRAEPGSKPAAAAGAQVTMTVRIQSVDLEKNIVVFEPPGGGLEAVEVERPEGREFIRGLKPGDRVRITYTEAVALSIEKQ